MAMRWVQDKQGNMIQIDTAKQQPEEYIEVDVSGQPKEKGTVQKLFDALTPKKPLLQVEAEREYNQMKREQTLLQARRMAEAKIQSDQLRQLKRQQPGSRIYGRGELQAGELANIQEQARLLSQAKAGRFKGELEEYKLRLTKAAKGKAYKYAKGTVETLERAPRRLARSMQGARRIEKGLSKMQSTAVGMGGYLFPMTGMQARLKSKGMSRGRAGRPQGVYKHVIPGVGPVHVYTWRKWVRSQRQKASQMMAMREQAMAQQMMKRGLPPQMAYAQAEQLAQLRQQQALQEVQQAQYQPQQQQFQPPMQYPQQQQIMRPQPSMQARPPINLLGPDRQMQQQVPQGMKPVYNIFTGQTRYEPNRVGTERWASESHPQRPGQLGLKRQGGY